MHPYKNLPSNAFWKSAISLKNMFSIDDLWNPKFTIKQDEPFITYGSCFAQHISQALVSRGFNWLNMETSPETLNIDNRKLFNYNVFSSRTGNIYTASFLKQWLHWAFMKEEIPQEIWKKNERFYCPFRPNIEPNGFKDQEELFQSRMVAINAFRKSIEETKYFIFTLGLTESWINTKFGYEYPLCPGTIAGVFDNNIHSFRKQRFNHILNDLKECIKIMKQENQRIKFIITVSPIPLTATNTTNHVLLASMESKSVLRAVAAELCDENDDIDYFPSYEIINSPVFRGVFFEPNMKNVSQYGVNFVMDIFFKSIEKKENFAESLAIQLKQNSFKSEEICEEALLELFGTSR